MDEKKSCASCSYFEMDLRDYYRMMAADISDEDMRKAAQFLSDHIGKANAVSKHDLTLALSFADRLLLLKDGEAVACGPPAQVLRPELLRDVFGLDVAAYMKRALARWEAL